LIGESSITSSNTQIVEQATITGSNRQLGIGKATISISLALVALLAFS
jgi:hypothetical protein